MGRDMARLGSGRTLRPASLSAATRRGLGTMDATTQRRSWSSSADPAALLRAHPIKALRGAPVSALSELRHLPS